MMNRLNDDGLAGRACYCQGLLGDVWADNMRAVGLRDGSGGDGA